jgi:hypothetical protein
LLAVRQALCLREPASRSRCSSAKTDEHFEIAPADLVKTVGPSQRGPVTTTTMGTRASPCRLFVLGSPS